MEDLINGKVAARSLQNESLLSSEEFQNVDIFDLRKYPSSLGSISSFFKKILFTFSSF